MNGQSVSSPGPGGPAVPADPVRLAVPDRLAVRRVPPRRLCPAARSGLAHPPGRADLAPAAPAAPTVPGGPPARGSRRPPRPADPRPSAPGAPPSPVLARATGGPRRTRRAACTRSARRTRRPRRAGIACRPCAPADRRGPGPGGPGGPAAPSAPAGPAGPGGPGGPCSPGGPCVASALTGEPSNRQLPNSSCTCCPLWVCALWRRTERRPGSMSVRPRSGSGQPADDQTVRPRRAPVVRFQRRRRHQGDQRRLLADPQRLAIGIRRRQNHAQRPGIGRYRQSRRRPDRQARAVRCKRDAGVQRDRSPSNVARRPQAIRPKPTAERRSKTASRSRSCRCTRCSVVTRRPSTKMVRASSAIAFPPSAGCHQVDAGQCHRHPCERGHGERAAGGRGGNARANPRVVRCDLDGRQPGIEAHRRDRSGLARQANRPQPAAQTAEHIPRPAVEQRRRRIPRARQPGRSVASPVSSAASATSVGRQVACPRPTNTAAQSGAAAAGATGAVMTGGSNAKETQASAPASSGTGLLTPAGIGASGSPAAVLDHNATVAWAPPGAAASGRRTPARLASRVSAGSRTSAARFASSTISTRSEGSGPTGGCTRSGGATPFTVTRISLSRGVGRASRQRSAAAPVRPPPRRRAAARRHPPPAARQM